MIIMDLENGAVVPSETASPTYALASIEEQRPSPASRMGCGRLS
jgi:hypothetical protein